MDDHARLERIFEGHDAPFALLDLDAMWSNADEMLARSARQADPRGQQVRALRGRCSSASSPATSASAG